MRKEYSLSFGPQPESATAAAARIIDKIRFIVAIISDNLFKYNQFHESECWNFDKFAEC
jgi:hypothetical protein